MTDGQVVIAVIASVLLIGLIIKVIFAINQRKNPGVASSNVENPFPGENKVAQSLHDDEQIPPDGEISKKTDLIENQDEIVFFDLQKVMKFYQRKINQHYRSTNSDILLCQVLLIIQLLFSIIFTLENDSFQILFLLNAVFIIWLGIRYYNQSGKPVDNGMTEGSYTHIDRKQFTGLWVLIDNLIEKMNLSHLHLNLYYIKSNRFEIYVNTDNNIIHLFISRGFLSLFDKKPKDAESILAHEFGHVLQGDNRLFLLNKSLVSVPGIIVAISGFINLVIIAIMYFKEGVGPKSFIGGLGMIFALTYIKMINKRKEAEHFADLASILFVEDSTILDLIESFIPDEGYSINHPSKWERTTFIQTTLKKFSV